ncbi:MAG TPA: hypothetical protein VF692_01915 [Pyrinomonadaceae bacterium]|jgi:arsenate reductase
MRKYFSEFPATFFLLTIVVGSGIMGERLSAGNDRKIDYVLTVCDNARENCPYFPAQAQLIYHSFQDPAEIVGDEETRTAAFRAVRDEIRQYLESDFVKILAAE